MSKRKKPQLTRGKLNVTSCELVFPVKGRPFLRIQAIKPNPFQLPRGSKCSVFILGSGFWDNVADTFGGSVATVGQGLLPNVMADKRGIDYDRINGDVERGNNIEFQVEFQTPPDLARATVHENVSNKTFFFFWEYIYKKKKKLVKLLSDVSLCLQVENDQMGVLFVLVLKIQNLLDAVRNENGTVQLTTEHFNPDENALNQVRGTEYPGVVDCFYILVGMEFIKWCIDVVHVFLFFTLLVLPWRWVQCCIVLSQHPKQWYVLVYEITTKRRIEKKQKKK
ncbi:hypothetical protein RFI_11826 [Reticulomyxa filosa]|uniref:Uncharacterized protein n=1 Tax=Reticulomyxa filosa TaxID=46433 RepID=X6NIY7_RETFI|nr:hypothetical protein RFI_11826 [Reticulomyxa filosa]|eukprot:ETO25312.1 hypothetical protein RFI_11826 [Reticulomyxa filosa]